MVNINSFISGCDYGPAIKLYQSLNVTDYDPCSDIEEDKFNTIANLKDDLDNDFDKDNDSRRNRGPHSEHFYKEDNYDFIYTICWLVFMIFIIFHTFKLLSDMKYDGADDLTFA